jgi:hypothetical protein
MIFLMLRLSEKKNSPGNTLRKHVQLPNLILKNLNLMTCPLVDIAGVVADHTPDAPGRKPAGLRLETMPCSGKRNIANRALSMNPFET